MSDFYNRENYVPSSPFSQIVYDIDVCKEYLCIEQGFDFDNNLIWILMDASASYVRNYTQMTDEQLDKHHESSLVFLLILSEFYNNRTISMSTGNAGIFNKMLTKIMKSLKQDWL